MRITNHTNDFDVPRDVLQETLRGLLVDDLLSARLACRSLAEASQDSSLPGWTESLQKVLDQPSSPDLVIKRIRQIAECRVLNYAFKVNLPNQRLFTEHFEQLCAVFKQFSCSQLQHLDLRGNRINNAGAQALTNSTTLTALQQLCLKENHNCDAAAAR